MRPSIKDQLANVNIHATADKSAVAVVEPPVPAPAAAPQAVVTPAPTVSDVKPAENSSAPVSVPPANVGGNTAVSPNANASVVENEDQEIQDTEVPEGLRKRFAKITKQKQSMLKELEDSKKAAEALKAEREAFEREVNFYKDQLLNPKNPQNTPAPEQVIPAPVKVEEKPLQLEDFSNEENPLKSFIEAVADRAAAKREKEILDRIAYENSPEVQAKKKRDAEFAQKYPDFQKVLQVTNPAIQILQKNPVTDQIIGRSKDSLELLYNLAKNPAMAQKVASMTDPIDVAMELADFKKSFSGSTSTQPPASTAPAPTNTPPAAPEEFNVFVPPVVPNNGQVPDANRIQHQPIHITRAPAPFEPLNSVASQTLPSPDNIGVRSPQGTINVDDMRNDPRYAHMFRR